MNDKAKTTISIKQPVYEAAQRLAQSEQRDFSFIVERALLGELQGAGVVMGADANRPARILGAFDEVGDDELALGALKDAARQAARNKKRRKVAV